MSDEPKKPDYSCPHIDKIIEIENSMVKSLESKHYDELETLLGNVEDALWHRGDIEAEAEKAREIHDELRKWGEWQQERADTLEQENAELKQEFENFLAITEFNQHTEQYESEFPFSTKTAYGSTITECFESFKTIYRSMR